MGVRGKNSSSSASTIMIKIAIATNRTIIQIIMKSNSVRIENQSMYICLCNEWFDWYGFSLKRLASRKQSHPPNLWRIEWAVTGEKSCAFKWRRMLVFKEKDKERERKKVWVRERKQQNTNLFLERKSKLRKRTIGWM